LSGAEGREGTLLCLLRVGLRVLPPTGCVARTPIWLWPKRRFPAARFTRTCVFTPNRRRRRLSKAVYRARKHEFRYTHDLAELLDGLAKYGIAVPEEVREAVDLTGFAWHARYPGSAEPVSEAEYRSAVTLAGTVVQWAEKLAEKGHA
jgi:HEPN domain-containing protein